MVIISINIQLYFLVSALDKMSDQLADIKQEMTNSNENLNKMNVELHYIESDLSTNVMDSLLKVLLNSKNIKNEED
jgi:hypothetical protein